MRRTVLIVDDSLTVRVMLRGVLRNDYDVLEAEDGVRALELARERPVDLIITDLGMNELDGLGLIRQLRRTPLLARVPVIVITSKEDQTTSEAVKAGAQQVVMKPVYGGKILQAIEHTLRSPLTTRS